MTYFSSSKAILVSGFLIIMVGSTGLLAYQLFSPDNLSDNGKSIVVNSVNLEDLSIGWKPNTYQVRIFSQMKTLT